MRRMPTGPAQSCFALVQVADEASLRARLPTALERGRALVETAVRTAAEARGGTLEPSVARAWFVRFASAHDATWFAADLQWLLLSAAWPPTLLVRAEAGEVRGTENRLLYRGLRAKVVVHAGRLDVGDDGRTSGPGVYQAARLLTMAAGGQVLLSAAAHRDLAKTPDALEPGSGLVLRDLGLVSVIGVDGVTRLFQALPAELDERSFAPVPPLPTTNLRTAEESTLGRDGDVDAICDLISMGIRLVTVVGPPGVGKSRICRLSARALHREGRFPAGVWWCRPGEATVASLVRCVAVVLQVPLEEAATIEDAISRIGYALAACGKLVLVVDHLAHRQRASAAEGLSRDLRSLLEGWMRTAPDVAFVVNTDVRFGLPGEVLYLLLPLVSNVEDSKRLFLERARALDQDVQSQDPGMVAELVERSGGLPLSIRLLAGIVDRFPVEQQLDWFRAGDLAEDRILEVVLDHLDEAERELLAACCALPGSFEPGLLVGDANESAYTLVDRLDLRGLVRRASEPEAPELVRYLVEEDVRRHVLSALPVDEARLVRDVRARLLLARCEAWLGDQYRRDRPELVARLAVEWEGLLEVVRIGLEEGRDDAESVTLAARAVVVARPILEARGPAWVAAELLDAVCRRLDVMLDADTGLHLRVLVQRAQAMRRVGRTASAFGDLERAEAMAERWSDRAGQAQCLVESGRAEFEVGSTDRAVRKLEAARAAFLDVGDPGSAAVAATYLGGVLLGLGRYEACERVLHEALAQLRSSDLRLHECRALGYLAMLHRRRDEVDASRQAYADALQLARACGLPSQESRWLAEVGLLDLNVDRVDDARRWLADAARVARRAGDRASEGVVLRDLGMVALVASDYEGASRALLGAVAIHRDRGEGGAEGADTGLLGWVHHLSGRLDEARAAYLQATTLVDAFGDLRLGALFAAWLAACEAERGEHDAAASAYAQATRRQAESGDPQIGAAVEVLGLIVRSRSGGEPPTEDLARLRAALDGVDQGSATTPVPAFTRLAWRRVSSALPTDAVTRPG